MVCCFGCWGWVHIIGVGVRVGRCCNLVARVVHWGHIMIAQHLILVLGFSRCQQYGILD